MEEDQMDENHMNGVCMTDTACNNPTVELPQIKRGPLSANVETSADMEAMLNVEGNPIMHDDPSLTILGSPY